METHIFGALCAGLIFGILIGALTAIVLIPASSSENYAELDKNYALLRQEATLTVQVLARDLNTCETNYAQAINYLNQLGANQ